MRTARDPFTDPDSTSSPAERLTGRLSPVSDDSSNDPSSLSSVPSTGTISAGRTSRMSPTRTSAASASCTSSLSEWGCTSTCATCGERSSSDVSSRFALRPA